MSEESDYKCEICLKPLEINEDEGLLEALTCTKCGKIVCESCFKIENGLCKKCDFKPPDLTKWLKPP